MFSRPQFAVLLVCSACTSTEQKAQTSATIPMASAEPVKKVELHIACVGDETKFDKDLMSVPAGAEVHLTLTNTGTTAAMTHNWVLTWEGANLAQFAADGIAAGADAGYVSTRHGAVVASTPLVPPGKSVDVTFTAPEYPGQYPYVCTIPGHGPEMKGLLAVTP